MTITTASTDVHDVMFYCNMAWNLANSGQPMACAHNIIQALCVLVDDVDYDTVNYTISECEIALGYSLMRYFERECRR